MKTLALPVHTADFSQYKFDALKIYDKATSFYAKVGDRVALVGRRYCRPAVTFDGTNYQELNGEKLLALIDSATEVVGWLNLGGFGEYQNVKLK